MTGIAEMLLHPLEYGFMRNGLMASILVGMCCATLGVYVVLRRMAFFGDALAHGILPGLAGAYILGINPLAGALVAAAAMSLGVARISRNGTVGEDSSIGIMFTTMFAAGIILMERFGSSRSISHILLGNILGVTRGDLILMMVVTAIVVGALILFRKELELACCDELYAASIGISSDKIRTLLLLLLGFAVVAGIQVVGVVLTSALLVTPAVASSFVGRTVGWQMVVAASLASLAGISGLYVSFYFRVASGPMIVLICAGLFIAVHAVRGRLNSWKKSDA